MSDTTGVTLEHLAALFAHHAAGRAAGTVRQIEHDQRVGTQVALRAQTARRVRMARAQAPR